MLLMPWGDVELFLAVSRTGSLRAAGEALGLDVSTVSRRLTALEARVAAQLFDRSRSGIVPTPLAQALVAHAEAMERGAHAFVRGVQGFERDVAGEVRVTVPPSVGDLFLPDLVAGLAETHPKLSLTLDVSDELVDIERRRADLGLRLVRPGRGELTARRLAHLPHRVLARPDLAERLGTIRRWSDVPWVRPETGPVGRALAKLTSRPPLLTTDSIPAQVSLVTSGLGVAVLPSFFAPRLGLVPLRGATSLVEPCWPEPTLWLVGHAAQRRVPRVEAMARWLAERVRQIVGARAG